MPGITNPAEEYFKDGIWGWASNTWEKLVSYGGRLFTALHGWDGSAWRKLPLLFGYTERWYETMGGVLSADGNYSDYSVAVPAGYIYVLQNLFVMNNNGARGLMRLTVYCGSNACYLAGSAAPAAGIPVCWSGSIVMSAGDRTRVSALGCLSGDNISASVRGYKMKIAE